MAEYDLKWYLEIVSHKMQSASNNCLLCKFFRVNITTIRTANGYAQCLGESEEGMVMFTLEQNSICGKNQSYSVHTGHTGEIMSAVKDYLLQNPVSYSGDVDSLLEMIYFRYTEYNPVENERVKSCFLGFLEKLHNLVRDEEEENQMIDLVGNACAEYERTAYMEGIKVGIRLMMEVME